MSKNRIIILSVAIVAVIVVLGFVFGRLGSEAPGGTTSGTGGSGGTAGAGTGAAGSATQPAQTVTRVTAPQNVTVPALGQTVASSVAPPQAVSPANAHTASQYRSFSIQAKNNAFTPNTIIVNQGDIVNISVAAVDKNYDFTQPDYSFRQAIPMGQSKTIQFGATASGKFTFYCASCGGPSSGPIGYIIVAAK